METTWRWMLLTAVAPVAWGSTYYVTREFLPADDPLWGAALRALPAGLLLLVLARRLPRGAWWWRSAVLGVLNVGAFFVLVYVASTRLPSSVASTVMATSAITLMLLAWPLLGERPAWRGLAGASAGLVGVVVLVVEGGAAVDPWGVAASATAMLLSSTGYVLTKRWAPAEPMTAVTAWQLTAGGLLLLPVAAAVDGAPPVLDASAVAGFAYVSLVATAVAFVAWFTGLRHLPAGAVGVVGLLNPVTGVLLGTLLADESFGPRRAAGTMLVLGGVLLAARSARQTPRRVRTGAGSSTTSSIVSRSAAVPARSTTAQCSP
ncbi:DMT family transporter [Isoptericola sp. b515]|uniref:DMT family transporter n=2 Tax=Isoptericola TaxID=254250 RepID=UPI00351558C7